MPSIYENLSVEELIDAALERNEGEIASNGALLVKTGKRTGRSPLDRFIVEDESTQNSVDWGDVNKPFDSEAFINLWQKVEGYLNERDTFVSSLHVGEHSDYYVPVKIRTEWAWHNLFGKQMFIRPDKFNPNNKDSWEIMSAPQFVCDPDIDQTNSDGVVLLDFTRKKVLLAGMPYAGEMKKSMFAVQNFLLPEKDVLPMHCASNVGSNGEVCLFFGLSGTGKTTLSTDPNRPLVGDDEHGWSNNGIFNFEGGCYAKLINLDPQEEPDIYGAIKKGALVENVVFDDETKEIDFSDGSKTQNTRVSYPINHIQNSVSNKGGPSIAGHPGKIIFLTCDAYGVLPPIAKLNPNQAMYHFISGYTAKIAGTERGIDEPVATFSPCFGGPFLTLHPLRYAELLKNKIEEFQTKIYMVNTGWVGNNAQSGKKRFSLPKTRLIIDSILDNSIENSSFDKDPYFNFKIPKKLNGIESNLLNPQTAWNNSKKYNIAATELVLKFQENYKKYDLGDEMVILGGPNIQ